MVLPAAKLKLNCDDFELSSIALNYCDEFWINNMATSTRPYDMDPGRKYLQLKCEKYLGKFLESNHAFKI